MNQKGSLSIIVLIVVVAVIIGAFYVYYISQQKISDSLLPRQEISKQINESSSSTDLKSYTSTENKFSLQYPSSLDIKESKTGVSLSNYERLLKVNQDISGKEYINIGVTIYTMAADNDLKSWVSQQTVKLMPDNTKRSTIKGEITDYSINGLKGYTFESGTEKNIVINENGKVAWFSAIGYETGGSYKENPNSELILNQIISSLKFLE